MNVSSWSIKNPIPAVMLFIMLTVVGLMGFSRMKIQNFPDIDLPTIAISAERQAHLHQGARWHGHGHGRVPPGKAHAGGTR